MKKLIAIALLLALCAIPCAALAEADAEEGDFFDHAREWWNKISTEAEAWHAGVAEYFAEGADVAKETLSGYIDAAEAWFTENYPTWNEEVQQAWNTLKEAAIEGTAEAREQAKDAYETIRAWMLETGETMSEGTQAIFEAMSAAAGIPESADEAITP